ncbi:MBL fold metallo-hydrolase [Sphingomonas canadensis]|uniref:MBL fold metallo-hydrolase n=1 Tax=Sphingomonas canadensis TaxID=1219257 RepID=A0ABW3H875_9SPHN|nr:MBL fold metallo-hydrolase [Sphingomonas canadensis]
MGETGEGGRPRGRLRRIAGVAAWALLWLLAAAAIAVTVVPHYLDRIYYRGPADAHFDGEHFFNPDGDDMMPPGSRNSILLRQIAGDPTRPWWPDRVALTPARPPARVTGGEMLATWIGHATMLVQADGINILTDPIWSDTAGPFGVGPRRVAEPGVRFDDLPRIDLVLVSHNHYDHLDLDTLRRLWQRDRPLIVTSLGNDAILRSAGIEAQARDWGGEVAVRPGISVAVTRNHHWGSRWFRDRNRALWSSFVVRLPHGNFFFAGDTGFGDGRWPAEAAALGPIRLAGIPIGAFRFEEGQMGTGSHIGPREAIRVWQGLGRPRAIPIHWGTFRLSQEGYWTPPRLLQAMLGCAGSAGRGFAPARIGRPVRVAPLAAPAGPGPDLAAIDACWKAGRFDAYR